MHTHNFQYHTEFAQSSSTLPFYGSRFLIRFSSFRMRPLSADAVRLVVTLLAVCFIVDAIELSLVGVFCMLDMVEVLASVSFSNGFVDDWLSLGAIRLYNSNKYVESDRFRPFISIILLNSVWCQFIIINGLLPSQNRQNSTGLLNFDQLNELLR